MKLTIVMYHYVRPVRRSRFPGIKGLETDEFRGQIDYIKRHYQIISGADLLGAAAAGAWDALPPAPALLTFDDGYADHFTEVFPILRRQRLSGCFFSPAQCVLERRILDVNKIHFILASVPDKQVIVDRIFAMLAEHGPPSDGRRPLDYWNRLAVASRFDGPDVVFIKLMLQRELPEPVRRRIVDQLFREYVTIDVAGFADELYLSEEQIMCMRDAGMYFGSHGYAHDWLDLVSCPEQEQEIALGLEVLRRIGTGVDAWIMCYPHGAWNESLLAILRNAGCRIGLTTSVGVADLDRDCLLTLPRLNTNDLHKHGPRSTPSAVSNAPHVQRVRARRKAL